MGDLEQRFFSKKHKTSIKSDDKKALMFLKILKKGIVKKSCNSRGHPSKWYFNFDAIY